MGASSWHYYTPYRPNPEEALQELRRDVFARGDYSFGFGGFARPGDPLPDLGDLPPNFGALPPQVAQFFDAVAQMPGTEGRVTRAAISGDFSGLTAEERVEAEQLRPIFQIREQMNQFRGFGRNDDDEEGEQEGPIRRPETIEELLEMVAEDGTHSILDIEHTGKRREFAVAIPMPARRVAEFFGSEQPTHEQVEENWGDASEELERWEAYYLTVYREGKPHEFAFIGCSGD